MSENDSAKSVAGAAQQAATVGSDRELAHRLTQLPPYTRSLLRIEVPVVVTLAKTRHPVSRVLDLAPGTILHFSKAFDEPLTVSVGGCDVAVGDAVKVGDKFGLRIASMVMPEEKFEPVRAKQPEGRNDQAPLTNVGGAGEGDTAYNAG
jgi:flagellar motor switch/type III secretory pathway protein FliN